MLNGRNAGLSPERVVAGLADVVIAFDSGGVVSFASESVRRALGWSPAQLVGAAVLPFVDRRDRRRALEAAYGALCDYDIEPLVVRVQTSGGDVVWMHVSLGVVVHHDERHVVASARAAAEHWHHVDELTRHARTDPLTGAWNRRGLEVEARSYEAGLSGPCAVLMCDLDDFKSVNDRFGHGAGDHVLVEVTRRLHEPLRSRDVLAHVGGDEFVIVLDAIDDEDAARRACERMNDAVRRPIALPGERNDDNDGVKGTITVSMSIGAVLTRGPGSMREWLAEADVALYRSKSAGKDRAAISVTRLAQPW